ncbi:hypothetical protein [Deinococcus ficus]|uniref:hypothetical protein n=1 Tax=Deinococcus ficus TaxID=317577 RepID=UPI0003B4B5A2|nr:hypothetical protein [Deinococcus ficus]
MSLTFKGSLFAVLTAGLLASATAQTAPATPPATGTPAATPAKPAAPATPVSAATSKAASEIAVTVSGAVKGQIVRCPASLKLSAQAVCLYVKSEQALLRPIVKAKFPGRVTGDWKVMGKAASLVVNDRAGGTPAALVLLNSMTATETLVVVEAVKASPTAAKPATPAGVVKGYAYVLDTDLTGVVTVTALGGGKYRLAAGSETLTVTVGSKTAQLASGAVELPQVPATDGKRLIFPLAGLRALGCTVTPTDTAVTVGCGAQSVGLKPIVF